MTQRKIKVYLPMPDGCREYLWATRIGPHTAKVRNIPKSTDAVTLGDLVRITRKGRVRRVIERCGWTRHGEYEAGNDPQCRAERWCRLVDHLHDHDIAAEHLFLGHFAMSTPLDMDDDMLARVVATSPITFKVDDAVRP